jgi:Tfp pilus assembly protein PilO
MRGPTAREKRVTLLIASLALVILWLYTACIVGPLMREGGKLTQQVREARTQLTQLMAATANESAFRAQHQQLEQTVASLRSLLPPEAEVPASIEFLSNLASRTNVKIQAIFPQRVDEPLEVPVAHAAAASPKPPEVYQEIPIQIEALAGYHQAGAFLSFIESSEKPMRVMSLRISANPKEPRWHLVQLVVAAYFAVQEEEGETGKPTAGQMRGRLH